MKYAVRRQLPDWRWWHWRFALLPTWFGDDVRLTHMIASLEQRLGLTKGVTDGV